MTEIELLRFYNQQEKQRIESLGKDMEYIRGEIEKQNNPLVQDAKRNQLKSVRNKFIEASERRIAIVKLLDRMTGGKES